jgi:hypothetical protein
VTGRLGHLTIPIVTESVVTPPRNRAELEKYVAVGFQMMVAEAIARLKQAAAAGDRKASRTHTSTAAPQLTAAASP